MAEVIYADGEVTDYKTNSLGYPLTFKGPKTAEVYDRRAGKVGATLESAVENDIYRGTLPEWQSEFADYLSKTYGQERLVNEKATADARARSKSPDKVKDILETVRVFHNRVKAGLTDEQRAELKGIAQTLADGIFVDPAPSKRAKGIDKGYLEKAEGWLTLPDDQLEAKITKATNTVGEFPLVMDEEGKPTVESLGALIKAYIEALLEE